MLNREDLSDAELITLTRQGDAAAYAVLYRRHINGALAAARALTRSRSDADDVASEAFAKLLKQLQGGGGPEVSFRPYLLTVVRNVFYDRVRRSREQPSDEMDDSVNISLLDMSNSTEDRGFAATAFASLPERWQLVLWHTEVEGMSVGEVAPLLGLAPNAVAALAYRAREGLRQAFLQAHLKEQGEAACKTCSEQLGAYVRDGLSARDRRKVDEHLDGCPSCRGLLAELLDTNTTLRAGLIPALLGVPAAAYLSGLTGKGALAWFSRQSRTTQSGVVAGAAAAAVAVAVGVAVLAGGGGSRSAASPVVTVVTGVAANAAKPTAVTVRSGTGTSVASGSSTVAPTTIPPTTVPPTTVPPTATTVDQTIVPPFVLPTATVPVVATPRSTTPRSTTPRSTTPRSTTPTTPDTTVDTQPPINGGTAPTTLPIIGGVTPPITQPRPAPTVVTATISIASSAPRLGISGGQAQVRLIITNTGTVPANDVVVAMTLPPGVSFVGSSSSLRTNEAAPCTGALTCTIGSVLTGGSVTLDLTLSLPASVTSDFVLQPTLLSPESATLTAPPLTVPVIQADHLLFQEYERGTVTAIGNTVLTCGVIDLNCANAVAGIGKTLDRQSLPMEFVDTAGVGTFNSSSADLFVSGSVAKAYLVWSGKTQVNELIKADAPDPSARNRVVFSTPLGVTTVVALADNVFDSAVDTDGTVLPVGTVGIDQLYTAYADVSLLMAGSGTYAVGDLQTVDAQYSYGGWSLVVVTHDASQPVRQLMVSAPVAALSKGGPLEVVFPSGVPLSNSSVHLSIAAFEGDRESGRSGDSAFLNGTRLGPVNYFGGHIGGPRDPADNNSFGVDIVDTTVSGVSGSTVTLKATSSDDRVVIALMAVAFDLP